MREDLIHLYDGLDPVTLAVRDMIGGSRELVGKMAVRMRMNANDMSAIGALVQNGPMGSTELAHTLGIRTASATLLIDRLERSGLVERHRDTIDRRRVTITETEAAREASLEAWAPVISRIDEVCAALPDAEKTVILDFLGRLTLAVDGDPSAGPSLA
ncbi:MarR family winged helix-turn-helix transcriptional regulator [Actinoplanes couchii]|uniref:MarR family transcriptional regulator n=1 Tax=Actinoplanes couchii TaxID=403638 RepID=A0ABQ3XMS7_9ACTN|nr:MarR family transcriptional regulator [Actinoplanes couchii]MDR6317827.1 DNA-binding MarR family transcriptional regulator [Actinoplanes couchii]GID59815.1 MarR family transcriptional regulator [Actinoplanes couchii]